MKHIHRILIVTTFSVATGLLAQTADSESPRGPRRGSGGPGHHDGPGGLRGGHGLSAIRVIDGDRDGILSAAELGGAPAAILTLDADGDGSVSAAELHPRRARLANALRRSEGERPDRVRPEGERPERVRPDRVRPESTGQQRGKGPNLPEGADRSRPIFPVMLALDADSDGALSATEIANATISLNALDSNKDGQLTREELRPLPPTE